MILKADLDAYFGPAPNAPPDVQTLRVKARELARLIHLHQLGDSHAAQLAVDRLREAVWWIEVVIRGDDAFHAGCDSPSETLDNVPAPPV